MAVQVKKIPFIKRAQIKHAHAYTSSATKLIIIIKPFLMADEQEPPPKEANTVLFLQPSDLLDVSTPSL